MFARITFVITYLIINRFCNSNITVYSNETFFIIHNIINNPEIKAIDRDISVNTIAISLIFSELILVLSAIINVITDNIAKIKAHMKVVFAIMSFVFKILILYYI